MLQEETKVFDVTKDGYPRLPEAKPDTISPSGNYKIVFNNEKRDSIFLVERTDSSKNFIIVAGKPVNNISWSDNRKFIFISTLDLTPANPSVFTMKPNTASLFVYSIEKNRVQKQWSGDGYKNFFTINDFLIFDDHFGRNSSIYIYNFQTDKIVDQIKIKNGCGLNEIPKIPDFGA